MNCSRTSSGTCSARPAPGFTLIEVMITVAIVAILAAVAIPSYSDYLLRGRLVEGPNTLGSERVLMEQYFQDNRTYADVSASILSPCSATQLAALNATLKYFAVSCSKYDATSYTLVATGKTSVNGATYTVNQTNSMATTKLPTNWGSATYACWITRKGDSC